MEETAECMGKHGWVAVGGVLRGRQMTRHHHHHRRHHHHYRRQEEGEEEGEEEDDEKQAEAEEEEDENAAGRVRRPPPPPPGDVRDRGALRSRGTETDATHRRRRRRRRTETDATHRRRRRRRRRRGGRSHRPGSRCHPCRFRRSRRAFVAQMVYMMYGPSNFKVCERYQCASTLGSRRRAPLTWPCRLRAAYLPPCRPSDGARHALMRPPTRRDLR